jgi:hypothetical protein
VCTGGREERDECNEKFFMDTPLGRSVAAKEAFLVLGSTD